ncbi:MAG TPA: porin [Vicinamibacterales bacterium]|nr:porin [Vicinamibacterales bacterium]
MVRLSKHAFTGVAAATFLSLFSRAAIAQSPPPAPPDPAAPAAAAAPAPAPETKPELPAFFRGTEFGGLVDAHYDFFSTKPESDAQYRNFDTRHDQFRVAMAQIWLAKAPTATSRAGYKVKLSVGPATTLVQSFEPGSSPVLQNIEEGFISYLAPIGKGLQFDFGKFVTQHGAEVIEAKDNWNYSRSLLFALAIPYYHSGVRAMYAPNDKISFMANIVNGWNNVIENNSSKTVGAQVTLKPTAALSLVQNYMAGPEQPDDNADWRHLSDTTVTYAFNPKFSVMGNYDYGTDTVLGEKVHWQGVAGYARVQARPWLAFSPRFEIYDDASGFTTGAVQKLKEATATLELKPADTFMWRIEYRSDFSDSAVFKLRDGGLKKRQNSIAFGVLYSFSYKG